MKLPQRLRLQGDSAISPPSRDELTNAYRILLNQVDKLVDAPRSGSEESPAILFTASQLGEGCSTTSTNFARCMAEHHDGAFVLVEVNANPNAASIAEPGWMDVAAGTCAFEEALTATAVDNLARLPRGGERAAPSSPTVDDGVAELLRNLRRKFSYVVVDGPPLFARAELLRWIAHVDGVALVVEANRTRRETLDPNVKFLGESSTLLGVVLNKRQHFIPDWLYRQL